MNIIFLYVEYLIFGDGKSGQNILKGFSLVGAGNGFRHIIAARDEARPHAGGILSGG